MQKTLDHALDFIDDLDDSPISVTQSLEEIRKKLDKPLQDTGIEPEKIIEKANRFSTFLKENYSLENEKNDVLKAWGELLANR